MPTDDTRTHNGLLEKEDDDSHIVTEPLTKMKPWIHRFLAVWFIVLGTGAIWILLDFWPLPHQTPDRPLRTEQDSVFITNAQQPSNAIDGPGNCLYTRWKKSLNGDQVFFLVALWAGILGGTAHGLSSLMDFRGSRRLFSSWTLWYFCQPIMGGIMAVIFYIALRAGLVSNTGATNVLSPFGVAAMSTLVGLFTDSATTKLADVFRTLFSSTNKARSGQLNPGIPKKENGKGKTKN